MMVAYRLAILLEVVRGVFRLPIQKQITPWVKPRTSLPIYYAPSADYLILRNFDSLSNNNNNKVNKVKTNNNNIL